MRRPTVIVTTIATAGLLAVGAASLVHFATHPEDIVSPAEAVETPTFSSLGEPSPATRAAPAQPAPRHVSIGRRAWDDDERDDDDDDDDDDFDDD